MKECSIPGCGKPHNAKGFCKNHYAHNHTYGHPTIKPPKPPPAECTVEGCLGLQYRKGYCRPHHYRWEKHGNAEAFPLQQKNRICSVDGCEDKYFCKDYCVTHYVRMKHHGTTDSVRVRRAPGTDYTCEKCGIYKAASEFKSLTSKTCRRCCQDYQNEWRKDNEDYKQKNRKAWVLRVYGAQGLPLEEARLAGESCEVCGSMDNLVIDHCHTSSKVRGLICQRCNLSLGAALDSPDTLLGLVEYLTRFQLGEESPNLIKYRKTG